jgi:hypothetical protein
MHENFRTWPYERKKIYIFSLFFRLYLTKKKKPFLLITKLLKQAQGSVFQTPLNKKSL